jgi:hypothetical protein
MHIFGTNDDAHNDCQLYNIRCLNQSTTSELEGKDSKQTSSSIIIHLDATNTICSILEHLHNTLTNGNSVHSFQ